MLQNLQTNPAADFNNYRPTVSWSEMQGKWTEGFVQQNFAGTKLLFSEPQFENFFSEEILQRNPKPIACPFV